MNAAQIADQAIAKLEAEEAGIIPEDDKNAKGGDDDKTKQDDTKDDGASKSKDSGDTKKSDAEGDSTPKYDKDGKRIEVDKTKEADKKDSEKDTKSDKDKKKEDEEGFTADDALEVETPADDKPSAPTDNAGIQLSTSEQKFIADNIGEPIIIRGIRGEGDNSKEVEIKAYHVGDIPADFKFANDQQMLAAQTGFASLEQKANQLLGNYRQNQSQNQAQEFERRENEGIRADVADLQRDGRFPRFKVRPGEQGFDNSPEAKQMAEVLTVMAERNDMYLKQYEQGRPYKHIGFAEAYDLWEAKNPASQTRKQEDNEQKREDDARKKTAETGNSNRGMNPSNIVKPTVPAGTTTRDILARYESDDSW